MISSHLRCTGCLIPAKENAEIGDKCHGDCKYCLIVEVIEDGRYWVELSKQGNKIGATGFIGTNISREFGCKEYSKLSNAQKNAKIWVEKKHAEAA